LFKQILLECFRPRDETNVNSNTLHKYIQIVNSICSISFSFNNASVLLRLGGRSHANIVQYLRATRSRLSPIEPMGRIYKHNSRLGNRNCRNELCVVFVRGVLVLIYAWALLFTIVVEILLGLVLKRKIGRLLPNKVAYCAQVHVGVHNLKRE